MPRGWCYRLAIPFVISTAISELRTALNQKLRTLVADGVTDPIELREWALESLLLS